MKLGAHLKKHMKMNHRDPAALSNLLEKLVALPKETEWLEFKLNRAKHSDIGEYISALSNAAALHNQKRGFIVWGVDDRTHEVRGTTFRPQEAKEGNEELENWLSRGLMPRPDFRFHEIRHQGTNRITNLGALLFSRNLRDFPTLQRKSLRIVFYDGNDRLNADSEKSCARGYAAGFSSWIRYINDRLPVHEEIVEALRKEVRDFPIEAVRELVANALTHQDFHSEGSGPTVEVFWNRLEVVNPGAPLIEIDRLLDSPPRSRNDGLARLMRRLNICEERGSGIDKIVSVSEDYQLPPPSFEVAAECTRATLFSPQDPRSLRQEDLTRACYQHSCLKYVSKEKMTKRTLLRRLGHWSESTDDIDPPSAESQREQRDLRSAMVSKVIKDSLDAELIRQSGYEEETDRSTPFPQTSHVAAFVPFWA